ncbi:hypothetical protein AN911_04655 [Mycobacteroides immunogenum]|uniref:Uncharacterized protein n=1 Tax=Mycobacteroides immunogenum TaxID=83262 RepID=A0A7V8LJ40_9MYCO|nr:hypothetical protein BAB75_06450 [Mycobacteroides immunogenum]KPG02386.1 hypothetical protein AN908_27975 [Mycobacteroides immunogenum]KPG24672.1 hypothetical protein AN911_04655 [Mycobacteroides immunogenum]KPG27187.1 hypothetical protein AN914_28495 [Mycobacteroides immunogenum]
MTPAGDTPDPAAGGWAAGAPTGVVEVPAVVEGLGAVFSSDFDVHAAPIKATQKVIRVAAMRLGAVTTPN